MILDTLENLSNYRNIHYGIEKCIEYIETHDLKNMKIGKHTIDGKEIYLNIDEYNTKEKNESLPEAHRLYADIQIILKGKELIGFCKKSACNLKITYSEEKDIEFLSGECEYFKAEKGRFFLFLPNEVHHPCITYKTQEKVKKAVFKIKIN